MPRGRDLTFSLLSDVSKFSTDAPARDLDKLADASEDAGASLEDLERARDRLDLDRLGDDATQAARKTDRAFDAIARASRTAERKIDADVTGIKGSFNDVRDEALDTGREMGAAFTGGVDDLQGAVQELAANAGTAFGPVGIAAGVAASVGVGLVLAKAEELRVQASAMVEEMLEAGGRLTDEVINAKILERATEDPAAFAAEKRQVEALGIAWVDYARAKAGDPAAADRAIQQIADLSSAITDNAAAAGTASGEMYAQQTALNHLAGELGTTAEAYRIAQEATGAVASSTKDATDKTNILRDSWETVKGVMHDPVTGEVKVQVNTPSAAQLDAIRRGIVRGIGPVVVNPTIKTPSTNLFYPGRPRP